MRDRSLDRGRRTVNVRRPLGLLFSLCAAAGVVACDEGPAMVPLTIELEGRVGDQPFECGREYEGVGLSGSTLTALDFRLYVHDVRVVTAAGEVPVRLRNDGVWQHDGLALLDFESSERGCTGNAPTNTRLVGEVPAGTGEITGLRFRVGVPEARNHLDSSTAPSPLNLTSMYWGWQGGYKYLRVEGRSTGQPDGVQFHVGAMACEGDARMGTRTCAQRNEAAIAIDGFVPERDVLVADLAGLLEGIDLDEDGGGAPGCMAAIDDPECDPLYEAMGVTGETQTFFRVERGED